MTGQLEAAAVGGSREFGPRIRAARERAGLSQRQLAEAAGVHHSYVSKVENSRLRGAPSARCIEALSVVLGLDGVELLESAGRLPEMILDLPEVVEFLVAASERIPDADGWRALLDYVQGDDFTKSLARSPRPH